MKVSDTLGLGTALVLVLCSGSAAPRVAAQAPAAEAGAEHKSVRGTLVAVDKSLNALTMNTDDGKQLSWRFEKTVIAQLLEFKPGGPIVVIYRQQGADKAVTAVAFPGVTTTPVYVNATKERVALFSGPKTDGVCKATDVPADQTTIPVGGRAESLGECWCCAPAGETCLPGNKTGVGKAFLTRCYK
jgi:hypothetical protein